MPPFFSGSCYSGKSAGHCVGSGLPHAYCLSPELQQGAHNARCLHSPFSFNTVRPHRLAICQLRRHLQGLCFLMEVWCTDMYVLLGIIPGMEPYCAESFYRFLYCNDLVPSDRCLCCKAATAPCATVCGERLGAIAFTPPSHPHSISVTVAGVCRAAVSPPQ